MAQVNFIDLWHKNLANLEKRNGRYGYIAASGSGFIQRVKPAEADGLIKVWLGVATKLYWKVGKLGRDVNDYVLNDFRNTITAEYLNLSYAIGELGGSCVSQAVMVGERKLSICTAAGATNDKYVRAPTAYKIYRSCSKLAIACSTFNWAAEHVENEAEMLLSSLPGWVRGVYDGWEGFTGFMSTIGDLTKYAIYGGVALGGLWFYRTVTK